MPMVTKSTKSMPAKPGWPKPVRPGRATVLVCLCVLGALAFTALFAGILAPGDPMMAVDRPFLWPGQESGRLLGTDAIGRDVLAQLVRGARVSLLVGFGATVGASALGVLAGMVAGYFGGKTDGMLTVAIDVSQVLPGFLLLIVLMEVMKPTLPHVIVAIAAVSWPMIARVARTEFRALKVRDFVTAARSLGYGPIRIMVVEILPNALPALIAVMSTMVASSILMEAGLSFLGLNDPNVISWGSMIGMGQAFLRSAWYLCAVPGCAIMITVMAFNFLGDGLSRMLGAPGDGR